MLVWEKLPTPTELFNEYTDFSCDKYPRGEYARRTWYSGIAGFDRVGKRLFTITLRSPVGQRGRHTT